MPTITFDKKELQEYLYADLSDDELRQHITDLGTDIDAFGDEISVEIFPDRPDLLSVPGLARALNAFTKNPSRKTYRAYEPAGDVHIEKSVKKVRPHTRCMLVKGLELDENRIEQIIQLQEKLHVTFGRNRKKAAIGIYPLEHITLPITYTAQKPEDIEFTPLEGKKMNAKQLLEQHPTGKKYAHLLQGEKYYPVFRDADDKVLSVPPIINSQEAGEVTADTKNVFVEVSGHEPRPLEQALRIIACALIDMGGTVEQMTLHYGRTKHTSPDLRAQTRTVDTDYLLQRSGIPTLTDLKKSLRRMDLTLEKDTVTIPCYRTDFLHDVDVIEDALIGYGYNNLEPRIPEVYTVGGLDPAYAHAEKVRAVLSGLGMQEVMTWALREDGVPLANPLTQDYSHLREELLPNDLDVLAKNLSNTYPQDIYELGPVFTEDPDAETGVHEQEAICAVMCGAHADYTLARQRLEALAHAFRYELAFEEHEDERFIDGRCAQVSGDLHGVIGEIHPRELARRGITAPASAFEVQRK